jgi:hypothetical protein
MRDVPTWIMLSHFPKIAVIANMVTDAIFIDIRELLSFAGERLGYFERF